MPNRDKDKPNIRKRGVFTETRKTYIKAIHKCIKKWQGWIDQGYGFIAPCDLCVVSEKLINGCVHCPLLKAGNRCNNPGSVWKRWSMATKGTMCEDCTLSKEECKVRKGCPEYGAKEEAVAMRDTLIELLPHHERKRYSR